MRKDKRDVDGTNFKKSNKGEIKFEGPEVCGRWMEYFEALLNVENGGELEVVKAVDGLLHEIIELEVDRAEKGMNSGREAVPSGLTSDMLKYVGCVGVAELLTERNMWYILTRIGESSSCQQIKSNYQVN